MENWTRCACGNPILVPANPIHECRDCGHTLCEKCCDKRKEERKHGETQK